MIKNHNIRFNMEKETEVRAWNLLHDPVAARHFRSQNAFVVAAINDYYDRILKLEEDPYLETREREEAFTDRIVKAVESKLLASIPMIIGQYVLKNSGISVSSLPQSATETGCIADDHLNADDLPENELIDFDVF